MEQQHKDDLPMTRLEMLLRLCYERREDVHDRVLTVNELGEYISWLIREYGSRPDFRVKADDIADMKDSRINELGRRVLSDPGDEKALSQLFSGYNAQQEDTYIISDHDISAAQVIRYMPAHWHSNDYFEVYYAFSGDCHVHFRKEVIDLHPGAVLIVAPGVVHANPCYRDDQELVYFMLRASTFDRIFWQLLPKENLLASFFRRALEGRQSNAYLYFDTGNDEDIRHVMLQIYREYLAGERYTVQLINSLMSTAFIMLLRRYEGTARLPRTEQFYWKQEYSAILSYIQTNYATVSLSALAEKYHYNEKQIRRIIENSTGMSYRELITRLRMENAAVMLRKRIPIEEIAYSVGYTTVSSFYRAFTGYFGATPREYEAQDKPRE